MRKKQQFYIKYRLPLESIKGFIFLNRFIILLHGAYRIPFRPIHFRRFTQKTELLILCAFGAARRPKAAQTRGRNFSDRNIISEVLI